VLHDADLLDRLGAFAPIAFDGVTFRATRLGLNPLTPSLAGGRWTPKDVTPILYTSLERNGALAEISFHLSQLAPRPSKPVTVHRIRATARTAIRLLRADLISLGVDWDQYGSIGYQRTQEIGAAVAFLECDGLIAPSARWSCENLMLFMNNHALANRLELDTSETVEWVAWARSNNLLPDP
jgi:RES domain-containing protein